MNDLFGLGIEINRHGAVEQRVACPRCSKNPHDRSLGINTKDGRYHCFRCQWRGRSGAATSADKCAVTTNKQPLDWSAMAEDIWKRTSAVHGTLGEAYLTHRCCTLPPPDSDLRYLPPHNGYPPTLCAMVTDAKTGKPLSLHFTKLAADGLCKAGTERDKTLLAGHRKAGGVIRLYPNEAVTTGLGIGEGIETCLAAAWGFTPVWSAIDAGNLATFPVLAGIESLVIFADHDAAGLRAAQECADRWSTVAEVTVVRPDLPGTDIADAVAA